MTEVVGLITARGGSKSIPGKNPAMVGGKPLIAWTIEAALQSCVFSRIIMSTDDQEIARVAIKWGAEVPFIRPSELARDESSHMSVVLHSINWLESNHVTQPEYLMLLQPTSPMRTAADIKQAVQLALEKDSESVISVSESHANPVSLREISPDGRLVVLFPDSPPPGTSATRRQEFKPVYQVNGSIYLTRWEVLRDQHTFQPTRTFPYIMPWHRSIQIDEPDDLALVNLILENRHDVPFF